MNLLKPFQRLLQIPIIMKHDKRMNPNTDVEISIGKKDFQIIKAKQTDILSSKVFVHENYPRRIARYLLRCKPLDSVENFIRHAVFFYPRFIVLRNAVIPSSSPLDVISRHHVTTITQLHGTPISAPSEIPEPRRLSTRLFSLYDFANTKL